MHQDDRKIGGVSPPDYDSALCEQQSVLLNRIDLLTRDATIHNPSENKNIHALKQEYNILVRKRAELTRTPLSDPMEVLPPDLWPDIIRNIVRGGGFRIPHTVNSLLGLISVSKRWCSVLTTLPVIWTSIELDQCEPDYLAKAMICIQLSEGCEIDLYISHLTADEWRGISSMIVPEGRRIRLLSFDLHVTDYMVMRQVLEDFTKLPGLQDLFLFSRPCPLSDQQYIHAQLTEKMPSIKTVYIPGCTVPDQIWNPYLTSCSLKAESLTKEAVESVMSLPRIRHLDFVESAQTLENIPSLLKSSFGSVTDFRYEGTDICRRLTWIGNNLSTLSTPYPKNGDANALLVALSRFPRLHKLTITASSTTWRQPTHTTSPHNSIRVLELEASSRRNRDGVDWNVLFSVFFPASPCLEDLSVQYGIVTDIGWSSIQSIKNLRYLYIFMCSIDDSSSIPLNTEPLRQCTLTLSPHGLAQLLARLQSKSLQSLQLSVLGTGFNLSTVTTTPYISAGAAFANITTLAITDGTAAMWELGGLSKLRELELGGIFYSFEDHMTYWVNDILEAILIRPRDTPALEKITVRGMFIEWDILLLMLERRNFLNEPGISSIKTLVFNHDPPYRLLYPLSELLGGRFVERDSNYSFSLEAVGERIWNESIPGCMQCHYSLRGCDSLVKPGSRMEDFFKPWSRMEEIKEADGDNKANEYLVADPSFPPELGLWLSGRRERRIKFTRRFEETRRQFSRQVWCDHSRRYGGGVITGDVLVGAHFVHD